METIEYNRMLTKCLKTSISMWKYIIPPYLEQHRFYHNIRHIQNMIDIAVIYSVNLDQNQLNAILGHDMVYRPGASDNEERSAEKFIDILKTAISYDICIPEDMKSCDKDFEVISQIILDTKNHMPTIELSRNVIDLDLFELGTDRYFDMMIMIRQEYCKFTDKEFNAGRIKWLEGMLAKEQLFYGFVHDQLQEVEWKAFENMKNELKSRKGTK
jgi:predicted metal-dependent HD superfamily phosphohydrolase